MQADDGADVLAWYARLEATRDERRNRPPEPRSARVRRQEGPTLTERLAAYPGRAYADHILATWQRQLPPSDDASIAEEVARAARGWR